MNKYTCKICNKEFESAHLAFLCPECKSTPEKCIICGKEFERKHPYTQKTCSSKCRGIYRKQSGVAASVGAKMKQTKLKRYGTLDPSEVVKQKNGGIAEKVCKLCGKSFIPETPWQMYCKDVHYGPCPVCGNPVEIKDYSTGPQTCSEKCRIARINATCLERYGNKDAVNSEHAKELARKTNLAKYGKEYYTQTEEYKQRVKATSMERYGTEYPMQSSEIKERAKQGNLNKYGVESFMQTQEGKDKVKSTHEKRYGGIGLSSTVLREKITSTNLENYGYEFPFQSKQVQDDIKKSNLEKYGTEWAATSEEANEKRKATNIERYGSENVFGSKEIQEKSKVTCIDRYGVPNAMYNPEMARITSQRQQEAMINKYGVNASVLVPEIREKMIETNMKRYGVPWYGMSQEFALKSISKINEKFASDLENLNVLTSFEFLIGTRRYDLKIINSNTVIEIDPTYTHNSYSVPYGDPHDSNYHLMKTKLAEENGYRCIHVFDWDDNINMFNLIKSREKIFARKCKIDIVDQKTSEIFTAQHHVQGSCRGQKICYGLFFEGELVEVMTFGKPRYNKNYDLELLRLCTKTGLEIVGGASRLFSRFKKDYPHRSVLSYCDYAKFSGTIYSVIGMKLSHTTPPAKVWSRGSKYITDNYLRQLGYDKIFNANYGKGTSNEQLMLEHGWLPVYDCGQKVFVYEP